MSNIEELLDDQGYWDSIEQCKIAEYIDKLHSQIKELEAENAALQHRIEYLELCCDEVERQLSVSQAREQKLRAALSGAYKALEAICVEMTVGERYTNAGQYLIDSLCPSREALALPQDTTALEAIIQKACDVAVTKAKQACIDLGAKGIDYFNYTSFVEAIDNLPTVTLNDLK